MSEHPLLFTAEMVKAVLDGRKTQTRRVPIERYRNWKVGDTIWARETWAIKDCGCRVSLKKETWPNGWPIKRLQYIASDKAPSKTQKGNPYWWNKRPSIFMPRWAARIFLEITGLRDERVQDIDNDWEDCLKEGVMGKDEACCDCNGLHIKVLWRFRELWNSINAKRHKGIYAWDKNPEVKVIEFERINAEKG